MNKINYSLSVVVPVYNAESTLRICLESILNQSYKEFELILVDDGSTDTSPALCDAYAQKDSRVKVFHIKNIGIFQARKLGVEKSSGKLVTFSDADDWLEENTFEIAIQKFRKYNPDILAYTYVCGRVEKHLYEEGLYYKDEIRNQIIPGMMYDSDYGQRRLNPSLCCKLIKKDLYTKVTESVKDRITLGEDALVTYPAVCLAESIFLCNEVLYHYNDNNFSCTHIYPLERITELKAFHSNMMRLFDEMDVLPQIEYQVESYVRIFLASMVGYWYGIGLSPIFYRFPYNLIKNGSKILIYGAGNIGKSYINELKMTGYAEIVGWADKKYDRIKEYHGVSIIAPEQIKEIQFNVLLIAVGDITVVKEIMEDLISMRIPEYKIIWTRPKCVI